MNGTRLVDLLKGSTAATCSRSELDVDSCAVDWEYTFVTEGISGSERVTRAQVRFIYLCGARKVIVSVQNLYSRLVFSREFPVLLSVSV